MKVIKFNEAYTSPVPPDRTGWKQKPNEETLIKKYNQTKTNYKLKFITNDGMDLFAGGSDELDGIIGMYDKYTKREYENTNTFYILEEIKTLRVILEEEIKERLNAKKYNL